MVLHDNFRDVLCGDEYAIVHPKASMVVREWVNELVLHAEVLHSDFRVSKIHAEPRRLLCGNARAESRDRVCCRIGAPRDLAHLNIVHPETCEPSYLSRTWICHVAQMPERVIVGVRDFVTAQKVMLPTPK